MTHLHSPIYNARVTGPLPYLNGAGGQDHVPLGPCLIERLGGQRIDIIWGPDGQSSVALPLEAVRAAHDSGHLLLLT
jgi:hypothetical protein